MSRNQCSGGNACAAAQCFIFYTPFVCSYINTVFIQFFHKVHIDPFLYKSFTVPDGSARIKYINIFYIGSKFYKVRRPGIQYRISAMMCYFIYIFHF